METHRFVVTQPIKRLDRFLAAHLPDHSRSEIQRWIKEGRAWVNAHPAKPSQALGPGDEVVLTVPEPPPTTLQPEPIPLTILYEDEDVIAIDKPAGMVVHPAAGHATGTLVHALLYHFPHLEGVGEGGRPGIVHRLDKDTSGILLVARHPRAHRHLQAQFKARTVHKTYLALVHGHISPEQGLIDAAIGRHPRHRQRMAVVPPGQGRPAQTAYQLLDFYGPESLLSVHPRTGRTHQIRVHLASIGHPVVGDLLYGRRDAYGLGRHFLHAHRLRFRRPRDEAEIELVSPLPPELQALLQRLL